MVFLGKRSCCFCYLPSIHSTPEDIHLDRWIQIPKPSLASDIVDTHNKDCMTPIISSDAKLQKDNQHEQEEICFGQSHRSTYSLFKTSTYGNWDRLQPTHNPNKCKQKKGWMEPVLGLYATNYGVKLSLQNFSSPTAYLGISHTGPETVLVCRH